MPLTAETTAAPVPPHGTTGLTVGDLLDRFGPIPLWRIRFDHWPGTATEQDVLAINRHEDRPCELVDGILVEKAVVFQESVLAVALIKFLGTFLDAKPLGVLAGEGGATRLAPGLVRIPDVAFFSWRHFPDGRIPADPIPSLAPDLAVEILSESNTRQEMLQKRTEYFKAVTQRVWEVDPRNRTVAVYTSPDQATVLTEEHVLDGNPVLPGFTLPLTQLFAVLEL